MKKMQYTISYKLNPSPEDIQVLGDAIMENAKQKKEMTKFDSFAFFLRDEAAEIVGGCNGNNLYGCLYIDQLWVAEFLRGKGYGTKLMRAAENFGKESGCHFIAVNTFDWEALDFYKKLGFYVEFERRGFDKNSIFYFLRKNFV
jgi:ribosomal protein S18 acetylase RimI-like enzyme